MQENYQEIQKKVAENIKNGGWSIINVSPRYSYTVGLYKKFNQPEIVFAGFINEMSDKTLEIVASNIADGIKYEPDNTYQGIISDCKVGFKRVSEKFKSENMTVASDYYGKEPFSALQIFIPDESGKFPWNEGCNPTFSDLQNLQK